MRWPSLVLVDADDVFRKDWPLERLSVDVQVLNRLKFNERNVNRLSCALQMALGEPTTDCFVTVSPYSAGTSSVSYDSQYGLSRRTYEKSNTYLIGVNEIWLLPSNDGNVQTLIECWRDEKHPERERCKHLFEVQSLNALVNVEYSRAYVGQWSEIQKSLTEMILAMKVN